MHLRQQTDQRYEVIDARRQTVAVVVVDQTICGRSSGGVRLFPGAVDAEEVAAVARLMTLKLGFLRLDPRGGSKIGVTDPGRQVPDRAAYFRELGRALRDQLGTGTMAVGVDLGSTPADVGALLAGAGARARPDAYAASSTGTARGIFVVLRVLRELLGLGERQLDVGIEGFGKVGSEVARLAGASGCRVVAVTNRLGGLHRPAGLDVGKLLRGYLELGDDFILGGDEGAPMGRRDLFRLPALDLLIPCAAAGSLWAEDAGGLSARVVVPGANLWASDAARQALHRRGVFCVPDFVANAGGVLGAILAHAGFGEDETELIYRRDLARNVRRHLEAAIDAAAEPFALVSAMALRRFHELKAEHEDSLAGRIVGSRALSAVRGTAAWRALMRRHIRDALSRESE